MFAFTMDQHVNTRISLGEFRRGTEAGGQGGKRQGFDKPTGKPIQKNHVEEKGRTSASLASF